MNNEQILDYDQDCWTTLEPILTLYLLHHTHKNCFREKKLNKHLELIEKAEILLILMDNSIINKQFTVLITCWFYSSCSALQRIMTLNRKYTLKKSNVIFWVMFFI